jgi:RNase adaptor protein for sRNA GlmZ degradation
MRLARGIQRSWNPDVVRKALVAAAAFHPLVPLDSFISINCCPFDDPSRDRSMSMRSGHHASILRYLDGRQDCRNTMRYLLERLERCRQQGIGDIYVAFVCKSGKHRSVGMATALRLAVMHDACYVVRRLVCCADLAQACRCGLCFECDATELSARARQAATQNLQAVWPARSYQ